MKYSLFYYFIFLSFFLLSQKSFSSWYLEPYLGFGILNREIERVNITNDSSEVKDRNDKWLMVGSFYTRTAIGAKAGWSKSSVTVGLDLSGSHYYNGIQFFSPKEYFLTILPGVFLSYKFFTSFRVYSTLIPYGFLISAMKEKNCPLKYDPTIGKCSRFPQNVKNEKPVIRSLKLGINYASTPSLNINLEYQPFYIVATGNTQRKGIWMHGITTYLSLFL